MLLAFRINKMHRQDTPALVHPSAIHNLYVPLISDPDLGRDGSRPADSPQISQPRVPSFVSFSKPPLSEGSSRSLHAVMQIWRAFFDAGAWCCHGLSCLAYSLIPGPLASMAGSCWGAAGLTLEVGAAGRVLCRHRTVLELPFKIRKAGVKSHFENLLLSVADALETTLLTHLIAKCKLIVCTGH